MDIQFGVTFEIKVASIMILSYVYFKLPKDRTCGIDDYTS